jgi:CheY-like chemotaxis protein
MTFVADGRDFELRLSTLPASRGERLVIRFLAQSQVHRLGSGGFSHAALQTLRRAAARPAGLVVFTGPTGSGKTSTLYAMLGEINRSDVNIITVENPVEYRIPGISQVEVNEKAGRTFAAALRSILRQDPDVILIGEIRDRETAEIAVQAAMTGHLVLTSLHTNDALTAIPRLLDLGVQPSILADALAVVASQRLCRKLCMHCRIPAIEPYAPEERAFLEVTRNPPSHRAAGCEKCEFTGFRGRLPIVDIIEMNKSLRDAVAAGENRLATLEGLREGGLKSLAASGSLRVISGDTTVREVMEAVGPAFWTELAAHYGAYFSTELTETMPTNAAKGFGVLLIGGDAALSDRLRPALAEEGLRLVQVADPEAAEKALHADEDIAFIVGDLAEGVSLESAAAALLANRQHISWARLPAAVFVPASLFGQEEALRASGTLAALLRKPADPAELLAQIRRAQAR